MFCKICGNKLDEDSIYCTFCGVKQIQGSTEFKKQSSTDSVYLVCANQITSKYDLTYKRQTGLTYLGLILLVLPLILYFFKSDDNISEQVKRENYIVFSVIIIVIRIAITYEVYHITKAQNRDCSVWGLLAFFLPSVTLIIVGQLKKLNKVEEKNKENVPSIVSFENNKIVFSDGVVAEIFQNSENLFFIQSHFNKHYYKTRESAIRAVYIYKKENIIIQTDLVK